MQVFTVLKLLIFVTSCVVYSQGLTVFTREHFLPFKKCSRNFNTMPRNVIFRIFVVVKLSYR